MKARDLLRFTGVSVLLVLSGCASSRLMLIAPHASFPISLTEGFYDNNYSLVVKEKYSVISHFALTYRYATASALASAKSIDLSDTLTSLRKTYGGDAIVNLTVAETGSPNEKGLSCLGYLTGLVTLGLISPSEVQVVVEGDIVKLLVGGSLLKNDSESYVLIVRGRRLVARQ